jgi:hypothetical protein
VCALSQCLCMPSTMAGIAPSQGRESEGKGEGSGGTIDAGEVGSDGGGGEG